MRILRYPLAVVAGLVGIFVGVTVVQLVAPSGRLWFALAMGVLDSGAIVYNGLRVAPPSWLAPVGVVCTLAAAAAVGWCVSRWAARRELARTSRPAARA